MRKLVDDRRQREVLLPEEAQHWTRVGMLAAVAIILGYLETFVPIPIPGVKLGLANIAILVALAQRDAKGAAGIALIKVLASGLLFGSPVMMAYSLAGTALALALMTPLSVIPGMHLVMVSVLGAMAHEVGQLAVAQVMLGTALVWYGAPVLLLAGCVTGFLCGVVATRTVRLMANAQAIDARGSHRGDQPTQSMGTMPRDQRAALSHNIDARAVLGVFVVFCVLVLHVSSVAALAGALCGACVACAFARVRPRDVAMAARPLAALMAITLVAQVASMQVGVPVATIGPVTITHEALAAAGTMLARLAALTAASLAVMRLVSTEGLVATIDWLVAPLRRIGIRTAGFMLALRTALEFVPLLAGTARQRADELRGTVGVREMCTEVFPRVVAELYASNDVPSE